MEYCGMWEWRDWEGDISTEFIHMWMRITEMEPFGLKLEWYTFGIYRKCLPLPKEIE